MADERPKVMRLRLRHPDLVFHVDITLPENESRWLATAMLAAEPDVGTGDDPRGGASGSAGGARSALRLDVAESVDLVV